MKYLYCYIYVRIRNIYHCEAVQKKYTTIVKPVNHKVPYSLFLQHSGQTFELYKA